MTKKIKTSIYPLTFWKETHNGEYIVNAYTDGQYAFMTEEEQLANIKSK